LRLLVVEDDTHLNRSIELMLKSEGHVCDAAATGEDGIAAARTHLYDIIILDLMLPDMDGYEVVQRLRGEQVTTPILILSGLSELDSKVKGLNVGADDYLTKPFEKHELMARIRALVRRSMGYSAATDGGGGAESILAQKGEAAPWSFSMAYTPYDEEAEGIPVVSAAPRLTTPRVLSANAGHVIVIGNEKGGTGKSTTAMHLAVALLREDCRVTTIDLDRRQGTLSRYIRNRGSFAAKREIDLPIPEHHAGDLTTATPQQLEDELARLVEDCDFLVIDTPGSDTLASRIAHEWADTLVTPINDSLVDLDVLADVEGETLEVVGPSQYSEMIAEAREMKRARTEGEIDWIVVRNRLSSLDARNKRAVGEVLDRMGEQIGFRQGPGLSERVIYRELFLSGLTLLDLREAEVGLPFTMSHVAARQELRALLQAVRPAVEETDEAADDLPGISANAGDSLVTSADDGSETILDASETGAGTETPTDTMPSTDDLSPLEDAAAAPQEVPEQAAVEAATESTVDQPESAEDEPVPAESSA